MVPLYPYKNWTYLRLAFIFKTKQMLNNKPLSMILWVNICLKSKLRAFWVWNFHHWAPWWNECSYIQLLLQLYFNNVIVLQSTKEGCSWLGKIKISYVEKSDVLTVTPVRSLYPSSADLSFTALIYLSDTWRFSFGQWMLKACRN